MILTNKPSAVVYAEGLANRLAPDVTLTHLKDCSDGVLRMQITGPNGVRFVSVAKRDFPLSDPTAIDRMAEKVREELP